MKMPQVLAPWLAAALTSAACVSAAEPWTIAAPGPAPAANQQQVKAAQAALARQLVPARLPPNNTARYPLVPVNRPMMQRNVPVAAAPVMRTPVASAAPAPQVAPVAAPRFVRPAIQTMPDRPTPVRATLAKPSASSQPGLSADERLRMNKAEVIREMGYGVDWKQHSASELTDMQLRIEKANHLRALGYAQDWQALSLSQLEDRENRVEAAAALKSRGINTDWRTSSYSQLTDIQTRVMLADRLRKSGKLVDWTKYSASELAGMEAELTRRQYLY